MILNYSRFVGLMMMMNGAQILDNPHSSTCVEDFVLGLNGVCVCTNGADCLVLMGLE